MRLLTTAMMNWFDDGCCDVKYLDMWHDAPLSYTPDQVVDQSWHVDHHEILLAKDADGRLFQKAADLLLRYQFYPETIMVHLADFNLGNGRAMNVGDRIVQRIHVFQLFGWAILDIIGITEISQIVSEPRRQGFTYVSVKPHVEQGQWSACVHWCDNGNLTLTIDSVSRPAPQEPTRNHPFMRSFQKKAHQVGMAHFKKLLLA